MRHKSRRETVTEVRRERILQALRLSPRTTEELRALGVFQTSTRILELRRRRGYNICTELVELYDREGYAHQGVARYHLEAEPDPPNDEAPTVAAVQGFSEESAIGPDSATAPHGPQGPRSDHG